MPCRGTRGRTFLLAIALLVAPPKPSSAGEKKDVADLVSDEDIDLMDEFAFLQEEDVVLTAAKHRQRIGFSPSAAIVITRKDIEESGATSFMGLLRRYAAVHVYELDPFYPTAEIRGTFRVLLRLDGRDLNLELFVQPFYIGLPVGLHDIERIEIVMGPNSALYGANAVTAVISVITRRPGSDFQADISAAAGEHGTISLGGLVEGGIGPVALQGTFGIEQANSWMDRMLPSKDLKRTNLTLRLDLPDGELTANGGLVTGAGRFFAIMGYIDLEKFLLAHAKTELKLGDFRVCAYWYGLRTRLDVDVGLVDPQLGVLGTVPIVDLAGDTFQAEAQYDLELFENNLLIAGADLRVTHYRSDQLVNPEIQESRAGVFLHDEYRFLPKFLLTLGARFDWNSKTESAISPRATLVYNPAGEQFLRVSAGRAFRKPTLMETSTDFKIADPAFPEIKELFEDKGLSNPDIGNELFDALELGYRGTLFDGALRLSADVYLGFYRQAISFGNYIDYEQTPFPRIDIEESQVGYDDDGEETNTFGFNFGIEGEPLGDLTLFLRCDYSYEWYVRDIPPEGLLRRFLLSTGATLRLPFDLVAHLSFVHVTDWRGSGYEIRDPESILVPGILSHVPARCYLLGALTYTLRPGSTRIDLGLSLFNPFGGRFREDMGVTTPDGSNYGAERVGTRAMLTARFRY